MTRRVLIAGLISWFVGCAERQGTQAVVTVSMDAPLLASTASLEVTLLSADGGAPNGAQALPLVDESAGQSAFSFGAVPVDGSALHLRLRALDPNGQALASQLINATLPRDKAVPVMVKLSASCVALTCEVGVVCSLSDDSSWTKPCALSALLPTCVSYDGSCGAGCIWPNDLDCPAPNGRQCTSPENCASSLCVGGFCCNERCQRDCASCARPSFEGICTDYTPDPSAMHCGGCNLACSTTNIVPHCTGATCDGMCTQGFGDCDDDKRKNGCETDLRSDPDHCDTCETKCPYRSCVDRTCKTDIIGNVVGTGEVRWPANRMYGLQVYSPTRATLAGLGIRFKRGGAYPTVHVRIGVYRRNLDESPGQLYAETANELSSDENDWLRLGIVRTDRGIEQPVAEQPLDADTWYWLFFIADQTVYLNSELATVSWRESKPLNYASLSAMPQFTGPTTVTDSLISRGDLYMITINADP